MRRPRHSRPPLRYMGAAAERRSGAPPAFTDLLGLLDRVRQGRCAVAQMRAAACCHHYALLRTLGHEVGALAVDIDARLVDWPALLAEAAQNRGQDP